MKTEYIKGDYAICGVKNAFNNKTSFWISKRDMMFSTYCFSATTQKEVDEQIEHFDSYIAWFECMEKKLGSKSCYKHAVIVEVPYYERHLLVMWDSDIEEDTVLKILDKRYDQWVHIEENPEVEDYCCEEWMLMGLEQIDTVFDHYYFEGGKKVC